MSTTIHRSSKAERPNPHSLFFRDLASPISASRSSYSSAAAARFATPGQAAAVSALRRESSAAAPPPPPPVLSLDDRPDFSPEPLPLSAAAAAAADLSPSPPPPPPARSYLFSTPSPLRTRPDEAAAASPRSASWWSPARSGGPFGSGGGGSDREEKGKAGSPVEGVVQPGALIMLPPPREVARPEIQRTALPVGELDEEEWVTVYGFSPADTNLVLREFEKCGVILRHIPGSRDANWMHILYQSRYDAQKALAKHAQKLNSVLIIGVKPIDPRQRQYLNESLNNNYTAGFLAPVPSPPTSSVTRSTAGLFLRPYQLQNGGAAPHDGARPSSGAIASPAKSVLSKVMDLMFGI
ncbi:nuclear pore complex protein NUP35 [Ananas comosus]|uniref:Nuclear pore complex protein NUP35 n=1 Tax=Ananas comosus TaxID=4615 RepID=A0A6P5FMA0_ANACO|nr:nuclear pore complex protein NUP35 [Ananas comosus]